MDVLAFIEKAVLSLLFILAAAAIAGTMMGWAMKDDD